jgi:hypothetical protein
MTVLADRLQKGEITGNELFADFVKRRLCEDQLTGVDTYVGSIGRFPKAGEPSIAVQQLRDATRMYDVDPSISDLIQALSMIASSNPHLIFWNTKKQSFCGCKDKDNRYFPEFLRMVYQFRKVDHCCRQRALKRGSSVVTQDGKKWSVMLMKSAGGEISYPYLMVLESTRKSVNWKYSQFIPFLFPRESTRDEMMLWLLREKKKHNNNETNIVRVVESGFDCFITYASD